MSVNIFIINSEWLKSKPHKMVDFNKRNTYKLRNYGLNLAQELKLIVFHPEGDYDVLDKYLRKNYSLTVRSVDIINWGNSSIPSFKNYEGYICNHPNCLSISINKLKLFKYVQEVDDELANVFPEFTSDKEVVQQWLNNKERVYCRTLLTGHSGEGIIFLDPRESEVVEIPEAKLYTKRFKGDVEFRFSVGKSYGEYKIIDILQKRRLTSESLQERGLEVNKFIKNNNNGYIYSHEVNLSEKDRQWMLVDIIKVLDLINMDFCAADVIYNSRTREWKLLELNSVPGLEGQHRERWINYFRSFLEEKEEEDEGEDED